MLHTTSLCHKWLGFFFLFCVIMYLQIFIEHSFCAGTISAREMWSLTPWNLQASDEKGKCWGQSPMERFIIRLCLMYPQPLLYQPKMWELSRNGGLRVSRRPYLWGFRKEAITWRKVEKDESYMLLTYVWGMIQKWQGEFYGTLQKQWTWDLKRTKVSFHAILLQSRSMS